MNSSSREELLGPLNAFVEQLEGKVVESIPWVIAVIAVIAILQAL